MTPTITNEQKELLLQTTLDNGMNAWDFMQSKPDASRPWVAAGILSCISKGYHLNLMMIGWEARDLRYSCIDRDLSKELWNALMEVKEFMEDKKTLITWEELVNDLDD